MSDDQADDEATIVPPAAPTDYEVGYRKPPVAGRFKPGRSGNPRGRPKQPSVQGAFDRVATRTLSIREGGRKRRLPLAEAIFLDVGHRAVKGDRSAQKDFIKLAIARGVTAVAGTPVSQLSAPVVFAAVFPPGRDEGGAD